MKLVLSLKTKDQSEVTEQIFDRLPILIGRSKICDLCLDDAIASRQHSVLEVEDGELRIVDLQSANGTKLNGKEVKESKVEVGDRIEIGESTLTIEKITQQALDESTVYDLTPVAEREEAPEQTGTVRMEVVSEPKPEPAQPKAEAVPEPEKEDLTLRTPSVLREKSRPIGRTKDWVQVSFFWKSELIDIQCFDRGDVVRIGSSDENDFEVNLPLVPESFELLKIQPQGVEISLHAAMSGLVETRSKTESLDEVRKRARQTDFGISTYVPFQDRCLIELGDFSFFIRAARLRVAEPLEAPLVREPFFSGVLGCVSIAFVLMFSLMTILTEAQEEEPEETPVVKLELDPKIKPPKIQPIRTPPKKPAPKKKVGKTPSKKTVLSGGGGEGARAAGQEGRSGREEASQTTKGRPIGFKTKKPAPKPRRTPRGAFGKEKEQQARRGVRADQGTGTAKPKKNAGRQAPSPKPKKKVRVEEQGLLGVLGGSGGGGSADQGGERSGSGLGGRLEGALEGLERGSLADGRGAGGRGDRGQFQGGGGSSLEVGGLGTKGKGGGRSGFGLGRSGDKGEAEVSYVVEDVVVRDGLTREEIERVVLAHQNEIRACYDKALIRSGNMNLAGRLKVSWFVNRSGRAANVKRVSSFGGQAGLFDCVAQRIRSWQFPEPRGGLGAQVSWPWVFRKGAQ